MTCGRGALLLALALVALATVPVAGQSVIEEEVRYDSGETPLAALILRPSGPGPWPAAVVIQGSGASDRSNAWSREMADALVAMGLVVLLTDKRGSGASGGDWRSATFGDLAGDALAGVRLLRGRAEVDPTRVGLVGMSQGGQVAPIAASRSDEVAFVVAVSSKAVGFAEGSFIEMANTARQAGLDAAGVQVILDVNAAALDYLASDDWSAYDATRRDALRGAARDVAEGFPDDPDDPVWTFYRDARLHDPLVYWVQLSQPVFIVYGAEDEGDNTPVAESVRRLEHAFESSGRSAYRILVVQGSGHGIRDATSHRLAPGFLEELDDFLTIHVGRAHSGR